MHAVPRHLRLEPLIQSQDVNEMKSLSLIGARWGRRGEVGGGSHVCVSELVFLFLCICVFCDPQGQLDYKLQDQDNIVFISTLHGG